MPEGLSPRRIAESIIGHPGFRVKWDAEGNIKRYRNSGMMQRWLAAVLIHAEKGFRRIKGYASIPDVIRNIEAEEESKETLKNAA